MSTTISQLEEVLKEELEQIKIHEDLIKEDLEEIERLKRKERVVGLKPIEIEKMAKLYVNIEQENNYINKLKDTCKRYQQIIDQKNGKIDIQNDPEDESDL